MCVESSFELGSITGKNVIFDRVKNVTKTTNKFYEKRKSKKTLVVEAPLRHRSVRKLRKYWYDNRL